MEDLNKNRKDYKHTPAGWIPEEWEVLPFGKVFNFVSSFSFPRDLLTTNVTKSRIHNIHYGDIHTWAGGEIVDLESNIVFGYVKDGIFNNDDLNNEDFPYLREGDLIIADASEDYEGVAESIELKSVKHIRVTAGLHTIAVRDFKGMTSTGYRAYIFKNHLIHKRLKQIATGISVYSISKTNLTKLLIPVPTISEQRKIAIILADWDKAIETTQKLIRFKELLKKGLMQQLLTGKKRLQGFDGEWKVLQLGELFSERNEFGHNDLPLLSITADRGVIYQTETENKDNSNDDKSKYRRICPDDIGYNTMRMWQGRSALSALEGIVSPAYTIVTPNENAFVSYFAYLFKLPPIINLFYRNSQGLVSDTLNCKYHDFARIKITIPERKEQIAIANILCTIDKEISFLKSQLKLYRQQKKGLMQVLLTGAVRVKV